MSIFKRSSTIKPEPNHETPVHDIPVKPEPQANSIQEKYERMFRELVIRDRWVVEAKSAATRILAHKDRYLAVATKVNIPWHMVGLIHLLEGDLNFGTHLHNGDSLRARTHHVPSGRPTHGSPPFSWEESAFDALQYDHVANIQTIGAELDRLEAFNGLGYRKKGIVSPYLWSGSAYYIKGKYVSDGHFDSNAVSEQIGAACVLKLLLS